LGSCRGKDIINSPKLKIQENNSGIVFTVKAVPHSSKTAIAGLLDDMLKVKVAASPEKGKANAEVLALLAKKLGLKKKSISITKGLTNPVKIIQVHGISAEDLLNKLDVS